MSTAGNIKSRIYDLLVTLKPDTLAEVEITDIRKDPLDGDIVGFPHAFVYPPSLETSDWIDNKTSRRDYIFAIMVIMKSENITSTSDVEDLMESIMNTIENDITLGGTAQAGIQPVTSRPEAFKHGDKSYIVFDVIIRARAINSII
jgi:hypothetical protein